MSLGPAGATFVVRAPHAERVELCIFAGDDETRIDLNRQKPGWFQGTISGVGAGIEYGLRLHGRWEPAAGIFTNPAKLLLDPYARLLRGEVRPHPALVTHRTRREDSPDPRDSAPFVPRSVVTDTSFDWEDDRPPRIAWEETLIYETHVKGLTRRHPAVPAELRGTFLGLATDPVIEHLKALGVTAVELLPVHFSVTEPWLGRKGMSNYWGYASIGFFAPQARYGAGDDPVAEFKQMVKALHRAGIEVILDVVFNHTAEANHHGPTLAYRGFDNPGFYRLDPLDRRRYLDWSGTGNSVDHTLPWALDITLDSLRYWAKEMRVDGFRFDLATSLGRVGESFDHQAPLFMAIASDPILAGGKLIAEPWDLGPGGYQLGHFPEGWAEWNGRFRDDIRDFWRTTDYSLASLARRLSGSDDLFSGRSPATSINFVTAHDGFTLSDLVTYNHKHNQANREHNRDGESHNRSWNSGVEGESADPAIIARRRTRAESLLATLFLARGVPMLAGGDELGRSQQGNNNAYSQDNELSWYPWDAIDWERVGFTQWLSQLRRQHRVLAPTTWLTGEVVEGGLADVMWFRPDGGEVAPEDWEVPHAHTLAMFLNGAALSPPDASFLVFFNSRPASQEFAIPHTLEARSWELVVDTGHTLSSIAANIEVAPFALVAARSLPAVRGSAGP